jgi:hypothetical protein
MPAAPSGTASLRFEAVLFLVLVACVLLSPSAAEAQTLTVLYTFTGEHSQDGAHPMSGVVMDLGGNLYGTTFEGGLNGAPGEACFTFDDNGGCGTVFKLTKHGSSWLYSQLYKFQAAPDGNFPNGVVIGPDGTLYGTTYGGGFGQQDCANFFNGCGIAFRLRPQPNICPTISCPWNETVLHIFDGQSNGDGAIPDDNGDLFFDHAGNIYGTTEAGGATNYGIVYELTPSQGGWTESIVFNFDPSSDSVGSPNSGLIADQAGNFYGSGGYSTAGTPPNGSLYQLVPSQSGWTANALQVFQCVGGLNGCYPEPPILDAQGNLVAPMGDSGFYGEGTVIKLLASNNWSIDLLYTFQQRQGIPSGRLAMDATGNLYGVGSSCTTGYGCIYKLTPSGGGYTFTDLYDFTGRADGQYPSGPVTIDAKGNLYGTAQAAGNLSRCLGEGVNGCGTVWELTP